MDVSHAYYSQQLQYLIEKSEKTSWSIMDLDWEQTPIIPAGVPITDYIDMISQLYHAELFTLTVCARLINELTDFQAIRFICAQMNEEARHASAYAAYIQKLGTMAPINEQLKNIFVKTLAWSGSALGLVVALNAVMESEAVNQQRKRIETLPCPIFKAINERIIQDEARHSGFGFIYLRDQLTLLNTAEKNSIVRWIETLWSDWKIANKDRYQDANSTVLRTTNDELDDRLILQYKLFEKIGLIDSSCSFQNALA